jgi:hypothetical protein
VRSLLRTVVFTAAAFVAAVVVFAGLTLPPRAARLTATLPPTYVMGGYHIHTNRSDGTGTVEDVAAAAARAGLAFVIFTDHGDATRVPDPPTYRDSVLCIDAVEISTRDGHVVALGLSGAAPYPLGGAARDVIEDVHRIGGLTVIAHPDSPNPGLRWTGTAQTFDGIEWINVDSEWRDDPSARLLLTGVRSLFRQPEAIAGLFARPIRSLQRWDAAARVRPVFGMAALDAHARIGWRENEEPRTRTALARPSYEAMFETLAQIAILDAPLSRNAAADAPRVLRALTSGRSYSIIRALASPAVLEFSATQGGRAVMMGERVTPDDNAPVELSARVVGAPGAALTLYANGRPAARASGALTHAASAPGAYRVEVSWPGADVPWLVSNPIVIDDLASAAGREPAPAASRPLNAGQQRVPVPADAWTIEREPSSTGEIERDGGRVGLRYRLGDGAPRGQYAALAAPIRESSGVQRIELTAQASQPMRASVQVRLPVGRDGERWRRSIYLDQTPRSIVIPLQDFEPADRPTTRRPIVTPIQSLLVVVDTVNTAPGASGTIWLSSVALGIDRLSQ